MPTRSKQEHSFWENWRVPMRGTLSGYSALIVVVVAAACLSIQFAFSTMSVENLARQQVLQITRGASDRVSDFISTPIALSRGVQAAFLNGNLTRSVDAQDGSYSHFVTVTNQLLTSIAESNYVYSTTYFIGVDDSFCAVARQTGSTYVMRCNYWFPDGTAAGIYTRWFDVVAQRELYNQTPYLLAPQKSSIIVEYILVNTSYVSTSSGAPLGTITVVGYKVTILRPTLSVNVISAVHNFLRVFLGYVLLGIDVGQLNAVVNSTDENGISQLLLLDVTANKTVALAPNSSGVDPLRINIGNITQLNYFIPPPQGCWRNTGRAAVNQMVCLNPIRSQKGRTMARDFCKSGAD